MPRSAAAYYEDGSFGGVGPRDSKYLGIHGDAISPLGTLLRNQPYNKTNEILSVTELNVNDILPGLSYLTRFSYKQSDRQYKSFSPKRTEPGKPDNQNSLYYESNRYYQWIWENTASYSRATRRRLPGSGLSGRNRRLETELRTVFQRQRNRPAQS